MEEEQEEEEMEEEESVLGYAVYKYLGWGFDGVGDLVWVISFS